EVATQPRRSGRSGQALTRRAGSPTVRASPDLRAEELRFVTPRGRSGKIREPNTLAAAPRPELTGPGSVLQGAEHHPGTSGLLFLAPYTVRSKLTLPAGLRIFPSMTMRPFGRRGVGGVAGVMLALAGCSGPLDRS